MTTNIQKPDLSKKPGTMPPIPTHAPTSVGSEDKTASKIDQVANRLARHSTVTEQEYDAEQGSEFVK